jgi:hypothetical protein
MKHNLILSALTAGLMGLANTNAVVLLQYDFTGQSQTPSLVDPAVNGGDMALSLSLNSVTVTDRMGSSGYAPRNGGFNSSCYYEFTLAPLPGYAMTIESVDYLASRSGATFGGPTQTSIRASFDGGLSWSTDLGGMIGTPTGPIDTGGATVATGILGSAFQNLTEAVSFRIYGWNPTALLPGNREMAIDDVVVQGSVSPVPEPGSYALAGGVGLCLFAAFRHVRRSACAARWHSL